MVITFVFNYLGGKPNYECLFSHIMPVSESIVDMNYEGRLVIDT